MILDISKIVNDKLAEMEASGIMQKQIEKSIEKTVREAIESVLEGYTLKNEIQSKLKESVSTVAADVGLSAYKGAIAAKVKQIVSGIMDDDMQEKIEKAIGDILVVKRDSIKLSEIFQRYREWVRSYVDDEDQRAREDDGFTCQYRNNKSYVSGFDYVTCCFDEKYKDDATRQDCDAAFTLSLGKFDRDEKTTISQLYLDGIDISTKSAFRYLNDFEKLLLNLYWNNTPIIPDISEIDAEDHYYEVGDY